jgi:hypothetical protein
MTKKRETTIVELRTCVDYDCDFVVVVYETSLMDNDQNLKTMNTYFDRHEMMMVVVVVVKLKEEKLVVVIVALDMDLRRLDNKLNRRKQLDEDNMVDRNLVFVNGSLMINVHFVSMMVVLMIDHET